ncbi:MAG TPA: hypothetical protein VMY76_08130 [Gemmatimonadales bacterium]|nr:hypothetical protein [Gemmatimonadales bacterium]
MAAAIRLGIALAGFAAALLAIAFEDRRFGWIAIGFLVASLLVRLAGRRRRD